MNPKATLGHAALILMTAFLCWAAPTRAQELAPVEFPVEQITSHRIGTLQSIRGEGRPFPFNAIKLEVIVSSDGHVESAQAISGQEEFYSQAEAIEMKSAAT